MINNSNICMISWCSMYFLPRTPELYYRRHSDSGNSLTMLDLNQPSRNCIVEDILEYIWCIMMPWSICFDHLPYLHIHCSTTNHHYQPIVIDCHLIHLLYLWYHLLSIVGIPNYNVILISHYYHILMHQYVISHTSLHLIPIQIQVMLQINCICPIGTESSHMNMMIPTSNTLLIHQLTWLNTHYMIFTSLIIESITHYQTTHWLIHIHYCTTYIVCIHILCKFNYVFYALCKFNPLPWIIIPFSNTTRISCTFYW